MAPLLGEITDYFCGCTDFQVGPVTFALAYAAGAVIVLGQADPRLMLPLFAWLVAYGLLMRWAITRVAPASQAARGETERRRGP